jgi:hypothetical protein
MAQQPKKRKRKVRRKVKLKKSVAIVRKDSVSNDTLRRDTLMKAPAQMPRDNGINMRIKIRRKQ